MMLRVLVISVLLRTVLSQGDFTLVQGGKDETPFSRLVVPSKTTRLRDQQTRRHRELPSVIFAPVEGRRVLTKDAFVNANSKETADEAFKIYDHFLATKGQSILAQVADPFFVTQPPERTTIATPSARRFTNKKDTVVVTTTLAPTFTAASVVIQEPMSHNEVPHVIIPGRSLRREEQRYPAETRPVLRQRMINPNALQQQQQQQQQPQSSNLQEQLATAPFAAPLQFATAPSQQQQQQSQQNQQNQQTDRPLYLGPPLVGFPQAVQSPFRAQFVEQGFIAEGRSPEEIAWANYLASRNADNEQFRPQQSTRYRPSLGGNYIRNRQPGRPIPLPTGIDEIIEPEVITIPSSPFEMDNERGFRNVNPQLNQFNIDEPTEYYEKPSHRLRQFFIRYPQPYNGEQQPPQPQFVPLGFPQQQPQFAQQQQLQSPNQPQFFITPPQQQQQQHNFFQQQLQTQPQQFFTSSFIDRSRQNGHSNGFPIERTTTAPQQQFTTYTNQQPSALQPSPLFPLTTNGFYNGPAQQFTAANLRREIAPTHPLPASPLSIFTPPPLFTPPPPPAPVAPSLTPPTVPIDMQPSFVHTPSVTISTPRSALSPNQKLDTCCRKQGVNPVCQNLCSFDSFNDKSLVTAFITNQCPGDQLGKAFDCASTKADHNDCCVRGGLGSFLNGKCLPFCNTHKDTPANVLDYLPCLQVFRVIRDCFRDYQSVNPNIFGD